MSLCSYCHLSPDDAWARTERAIAVPPAEPLTSGHVVVASKRHVPSFYDLDVQEQRAVWDLVQAIRDEILRALSVDTVHIGFADAEPGGNGHAVVHVVPNAS